MNDKNKKPLLDEETFKQELDRDLLEQIVGGITVNPLPGPGIPRPTIPGAGGPIPGDCDW